MIRKSPKETLTSLRIPWGAATNSSNNILGHFGHILEQFKFN